MKNGRSDEPRFFALPGVCFEAPSRPMADEDFVLMGDTMLVRIDEDLLFVRNQRSMTVGDLNAIIELYSRVRERHGSLFVMYDSSRSLGIDRSMRVAIITTPTTVPRADATAIFGASFAIRTLGNMIDRALVGLGRQSTGIRFFESEEHARDYLQRERLRLKTKP